MSTRTVKIFSVNTRSWAKSPQITGSRGTIVFSRDEPHQLWVVDDSQGSQKVTIQNAESGLFACAEGNEVVTVSEADVPRECLYWEIQVNWLYQTIQVPNKDLYWTVRGKKLILAPEDKTARAKPWFSLTN